MIFVRNVLLLIFIRHCVCSYYDVGDQLSISGLEKDLSTNHEKKENVAHYNEQDKSREGFDKDRHSSGHVEITKESDNSFQKHGTGYYKKGFHNTGFSNSYHKDEAGNKTSFYEDSDDEKGHKSFDKNGDYYENNLKDHFRDGLHNASFKEKNKAKHGNYDNGQRYDDLRARYDEFQNNRRYDDERKYFHDDVGRYDDRNRHYLRDYDYKHNPYFYQNYRFNIHPKYYYENPNHIGILRHYRNYYPYFLNRKIYYPYEDYFDGLYSRHYDIDLKNNRFWNGHSPYHGRYYH
ncbi:PREDICTED: uncharacterized protein LOC107065609 isoform X2 [Polistes dominula]|uniref:Uncharacterized protein LOC107065609 isoform X2 n=1 Tax=Polistes dominula TaxID=743375 RepID=A0ABM1I4D2_POLDO|nr:PREDICTED: uncharacterized protein LOC107065609 isoform X2 [Polistes dominula]